MLHHMFLALLDAEPRHGYELKSVFERFLGGSWPIDIGQVHATLRRMERDGLVESHIEPQERVPDRKVYTVTDAGRAEFEDWARTPHAGPVSLRDEFILKIAARSLTEGPEAIELIRAQRDAHLSALAALEHAKRDPNLHPTTELLLDCAAGRLQADLRWLKRCEDRMKGWRAPASWDSGTEDDRN
jgi:DNA-binding PadR family transcriptional regulator